MKSPYSADPTLRPALRDDALPGDWIDRSQETYEPSHQTSRVIPPSGDVSREGGKIWPQPSLSSRILVWGGLVAGAAAATAGTVLAVRAVVEGIAGTDEDDAVEEARKRARARSRQGKTFKMPRNAYAGRSRAAATPVPDAAPYSAATGAPRFADVDAPRSSQPGPREADRARMERQRNAARARSKAQSRAQAQHDGGMIEGLNGSISDVTRTVREALGTVTAAIEGFRSVAGQAGGIMDEFRGAADSVRTMFEGDAGSTPKPRSSDRVHTSHKTPASGDDMVDLRDGSAEDGRTHRL